AGALSILTCCGQASCPPGSATQLSASTCTCSANFAPALSASSDKRPGHTHSRSSLLPGATSSGHVWLSCPCSTHSCQLCSAEGTDCAAALEAPPHDRTSKHTHPSAWRIVVPIAPCRGRV